MDFLSFIIVFKFNAIMAIRDGDSRQLLLLLLFILSIYRNSTRVLLLYFY